VLTSIEGIIRSERLYKSAVVRPMMKALGGLESGQMIANATDVVTIARGVPNFPDHEGQIILRKSISANAGNVRSKAKGHKSIDE
jgi:hypothetical protein